MLSVQSNPLPGSVSSQSSVHETSGIPPRAFCRYSRARHKTAFEICSLDLPSRFTPDFQYSRCQYKAAAPIMPMKMTTGEITNASFLILIDDAALHWNQVMYNRPWVCQNELNGDSRRHAVVGFLRRALSHYGLSGRGIDHPQSA